MLGFYLIHDRLNGKQRGLISLNTIQVQFRTLRRLSLNGTIAPIHFAYKPYTVSTLFDLRLALGDEKLFNLRQTGQLFPRFRAAGNLPGLKRVQGSHSTWKRP